MKKLLPFLLLFSTTLWATPKKVEVWFLSPPKTANLFDSLLKLNNGSNHKVAVMDEEVLKNCTPMGDGCFHPQFGYINEKPLAISDEKKEVLPAKSAKEPKVVTPKTINAIETDLINCDKDYYFDIYCGQAKKEGAATKGKMEIWVDISSSFRAVDYAKESGFCERRSFVTRVLDGCPSGFIEVSVFDTGKKALGDRSTLCTSYGMNSTKRMIEWISSSETNYLLLITDIDELNSEFDDYLTSIGAKYRGVGVKPMYASEMGEIASEILLQCRGKK